MAKNNPAQNLTIGDSTAALDQYTLGKIDAAGTISQAGAGEASYPVQEGVTASGKAVTLMTYGRSKVVAGAAFNAGVDLASDANGDAVTAVSTDEVVGVSSSVAGGSGEIVDMILKTGQLN